VVARSIKSLGFGNVITLTHSYGFSSRYAHLQKRLMHRAEFIYKGQVNGLSGSTGLSNAPHLHYEIQFLAKQKNLGHLLIGTYPIWMAFFNKLRRFNGNL
jgi:murein DD-endopeptidase MepM/ murein hydrolase activator NlpD